MGIPGIVGAVEIGRGGFGTVYRGHKQDFDQSVAVKILGATLDASSRRRFDREVRSMAALFGHPHIVGIISAGYSFADLPFIVMEDMTGGSLADALHARGPYPWEEAAKVGAELASALEAAHSAHLLHGDVKPENVLYSRYGTAKLGDFGLAALAEGPETRTATVMASVVHAAPEILEGAPRSTSTDVYALASTVMTLILGQPPFSRESDETQMAVFKRISTDPPPDLRVAAVPDGICLVLERAMAKSPAERYSSASDFRAGLDRAMRQVAAVPFESPPPDPDMTEIFIPDRPPTVPAPSPPGEDFGGQVPRKSTPPARRWSVTPPARSLLAVAGIVLAVGSLSLVLLLLHRAVPSPHTTGSHAGASRSSPGATPTPTPGATAVLAAAGVSPDPLAQGLLKFTFAPSYTPEGLSPSAPELDAYRVPGLVAAITDPFDGASIPPDIQYLVFDGPTQAGIAYTETIQIPAGQQTVGSFTASGISDLTSCAIDFQPAQGTSVSYWEYICKTVSSDVITITHVKTPERDDATGESMSTHLIVGAIRNLAGRAGAVSSQVNLIPPASLTPATLLTRLEGAFDVALEPNVVHSAHVSHYPYGSGPPVGLVGSTYVYIAFSGPDFTDYLEYYVFDTPAHAQAWFGAPYDLRTNGDNKDGTIDDSGVAELAYCETEAYGSTPGYTPQGVSECYALSGDVVINGATSSDTNLKGANSPLAVTLLRAALMYLAEKDAS